MNKFDKDGNAIIFGDDIINPPDTDHTYDVGGFPTLPSGTTSHITNDSDVIIAVYNPFCVLGYVPNTWNVLNEVTSADTHSIGWNFVATIDGIDITIPRNAQKGRYIGNVRTPWLDTNKSIVTCRHIYFAVGDPADTDFIYNPFENCFVIDNDTNGSTEATNYPNYIWWVGSSWVFRSTKPTDNTPYLTRTIMEDGSLAYCGGCIDHFPADNDAFVWNDTYSAYVYLLTEFTSNYGIQDPATGLVQYLVWDGTSCWMPNSSVSGSDIYLEKFSDDLVVGYKLHVGQTLPYTLDNTNKAIEYSKSRPWCLRTIPETIFVYNENHNAFRAFKQKLLYDNEIIYSDLPPYLSWSGSTWVSSETLPSEPYCQLVADDDSIDYISYNLIGNKPYDSDDPCNIAIAKLDTIWFPVNITMPSFVYDPDCNCFCADEDLLEQTLVIDPSTDLPQYLIWDATSGCWIPSNTPPTDPNTPYLVLSVSDGKVCYSLPPGWDLPYSINDNNTGIQIGEDSWCPSTIPDSVLTYDPDCNCLVINIGDLPPGTTPESLPNFLVWSGTCWESYDKIPVSGGTILEKKILTEQVEYILFNLPPLQNLVPPAIKRLTFGVEENDQPDFWVWNTNLEWVGSSGRPPGGQYLEKTSINSINSYILHGLYTTDSIIDILAIIWSVSNLESTLKNYLLYDDSNNIWINSDTVSESNLYFTKDEDNNYLLSGIMSIEALLSLLGQAIAAGGDDSNLSAYKNQTSSSVYVNSTTQPSNSSTIYYKLINRNNNWLYQLSGGIIDNPVWPYDITDWANRAVTLTLECGNVTSVDPPVFVYDPDCNCFCIDLDKLEDDYFIHDPDMDLPQYLVYDSDSGCWIPWTGEGVPPEPYLELNVSSTKVCYDVEGDLPEGYSVTEFPGIDMGGGTADGWCPTTIDDPIFVWNPDCGCFCADLEDLINEGLFPENLPPYLVWNGSCWVGSETCPENSSCLQLEISATQVCYVVTDPDGMPYDPESVSGPGNAIEWGWDNEACPVQTDYPPYSFEDCPILRFSGTTIIRGKLDENGDFRPCDPINAEEAIQTMPEGTVYKKLTLYYHTSAINSFELIDNTDDKRLVSTDKIYFTAWYRFTHETYNPTTEGNGPGSDNERIYLSTFKNRVYYDKLCQLKEGNSDNIEFLILITPTDAPIDEMLPSILRVS